MVTYIIGDLFKSPAKVLVNTVNTVGVMGKGIAKMFKAVYPEMFLRYQHLCERGELTVGRLWLYKTSHKWILNFPTKVSWKHPSKPEYIEAGLKRFVATYSQHGITSIAFPKLGCGNGELDWERTVRPLMEKYLAHLAIDIFVYLHNMPMLPEHDALTEMRTWLRAEPETLAFDTAWDDIIEVVGSGLSLETKGHESFTLALTPKGDLLLRLRNPTLFAKLVIALQELFQLRQPRVLDRDKVLIPQDCMLDLWQAIRGYGFCTARMMPGGLDILAPYLMPLLERLTYMRPVQLSRRKTDSTQVVEAGLQLYAPSMASSDHADPRPAPIAHRA
jgi:O-acetyl-ADP-ribose deacetylase (regulator of RNase III)